MAEAEDEADVRAAAPTLRQALALDAVARHRSFGLAADQLNLSQPAVSRLVAEAEKRLGVVVLQRGWSGAEVTPRGESVIRHCAGMVAAMRRAEERLSTGRGPRPAHLVHLRDYQLEALEAVGRTGSASRAGVELGLSQPAVSRALAAARGPSGLALVRRGRHGLELLPDAAVLLDLHRSVTRQRQLLALALAETGGTLYGRVSIGMLPFSGQDLVPQVFAELTRLAPKLQLVCVPGSYLALTEALRRGEIDRIIGIMRGAAVPAGLVESFLYPEEFTIIARSDHPCHGKARVLQDLAAESWVVAPHGTPVRDYFERVFRQSGQAPPTQTCEILSFSAAETMILGSPSLALLSYGAAARADLPRGLAVVDVALPHAGAPIGLTARAGAAEDPALGLFERVLRQRVAAQMGSPHQAQAGVGHAASSASAGRAPGPLVR